MRRLLPVLVLLAMLAPSATAAAATSIVEVPISGPRDIDTLARLGFDLDLDEDLRGDHADVVLHDAAERSRLAAVFPFEEVIADYEAYLSRSLATDRAAVAAAGPADSALPSGRQTYRVLDDFYAELDALAQGNPGLVRRVDLPRKSVEGRTLTGIEIAQNVNAVDDGRPAYVVMGLHHAREWPSAEVNMEFALDLVKNFRKDPRITQSLRSVRVFVFPVINPDGFVVSRGEVPHAGAGVNPLQRKNCALDSSGPSEPCALRDSVDLNRNYGAYWGGPGASTDPTDDTWRGPAPWSEPETRAVWEFSQHRTITNFQSIHNVAALVLRPPGFMALGLAPDEKRLKLLGDAMGAATGYSSEYGYQLYEVTGATEDWNYVAQNAFGYTIELGGDSSGAPTFQGPYKTHVIDQYLGAPGTPQAGKGVREALLLAGEQAANQQDHSVLKGTAPAGRVLRLRKSFKTTTSPICRTSSCAATDPPRLLDDGLDVTTTVPANGFYKWHVNPSTRPFERKQGRTEAWEMTCENSNGRVLQRTSVLVRIGEVKTVNLPCTG